MATNVTSLAAAMEAAGFRSNKALAEAAGISPAAVGAILKRGTCNSTTARKLQDACGVHKIGPLMQPRDAAVREEREAAVPDVFDHVRFEGSPWYRDVVGHRLVVTGTRIVDGLTTWGATVYEQDGTEVVEDFRYSSPWIARAWGKAAASGKPAPEVLDIHIMARC